MLQGIRPGKWYLGPIINKPDILAAISQNKHRNFNNILIITNNNDIILLD